MPLTDGTTWSYAVNDEPGGASTLLVRIAGTEQFENRTVSKLETTAAGQVKKIELLNVDDHGVSCVARTGRDGVMLKLEPPELVVPSSLKLGSTFEVNGDVAGVRMLQRYTVVAEENVLVPAGNIRAVRVHCDGASLMSVSIDRWFATGLGMVKEVTTVRGPSGGLLQRTTTELQKRPEVIALPSPTPTATPAPTVAPTPTATQTPAEAETTVSPAASTPAATVGKRLVVEVSSDVEGGMTTEFKSDVEKIYVRWRGHDLPEGAKVRVAWVVEDVGGIVDANFVVDETETVIPSPNASARFTLGRPEDGWAEGKYRVEVFINDELEEKINVTIR